MDVLTRPRGDAIADEAFAALPEEAPVAMPTQSLRAPPGRSARPATSPRGIFWRRAYVIGGTLVLAGLGAREMHRALAVGGLTPLELIVLLLFAALFAWIAFSFVSALAGFASLLARGGLGLGIARDGPLPALTTRTALLMPIYNESPTRIMAGLEAICESLEATGASAQFDVFILSDTTSAEIWLEEEAAFVELRARMGGKARVFYRRRPSNVERKAGNIAEWVRRFGGAYEQMLILDADSLMTGEAIVRLAAAMERHPAVGLIQTLPIIVNGTTLFARMQQFAGRVYGPLIAHGIAWWHGAEGNYWGHNAIIRTRAFAENAGLPTLAGRKPFGGHIMSHDFIEAALLRRGGWAIHMVPSLAGSFEESPPSLSDIALRDRRWCQGNLQHAAVLPARRLHWVSRLHLLTGIGSYITAPMWLLFLLIGIAIALQARFVPPEYFPSGPSLFPQWPIQDPVRSAWVFVGTMGVLLVPKLLSWIALLTRPEDRRGCGGALRSLASLLVETVIAGLIAPVTMVIQSADVVLILMGRDSGWRPQRRDDGAIPTGEIARRYWRHTAFGLALAIGSYAVSPMLLMWMSPVVLGLSLAIPIAAWTARRGPGQTLLRLGLLRIPEEVSPPSVIARARAIHEERRRAADARPALERLLDDRALLEAHRRMLPPPRDARAAPLNIPLVVAVAKLDRADTLEEAWDSLDAGERVAILADAGGLDRLARLPRGARRT